MKVFVVKMREWFGKECFGIKVFANKPELKKILEAFKLVEEDRVDFTFDIEEQEVL